MFKFLSMRMRRKGFTLIELLVVIAIIGILATVVLGALNSARQRSRDARRISDVKSQQLALELYFDACNGYPDSKGTTAAVILAGDIFGSCGTTMTTYLPTIPANPTPGGSTYLYCGKVDSLLATACSASGASYNVTFTLEQPTAGLLSAVISAGSPNKICSTGQSGC